MYIVYVSLLLLTSTCASNVSIDDRRVQLMNYLFNTERYDKRIVPSVGKNSPMNISLALTVFEFTDLVERRQELITSCLLHQIWVDPKLKWNSEEYAGVTSLKIASDLVWYPDIVSYNSKATVHRLVHGSLLANGTVKVSFSMVLETFCQFDIKTYPFDKHECKIVFGSWGFSSELLVVKKAAQSLNLKHYVSNGAWKLEYFDVENNEVYYAGVAAPYHDVTFVFVFQRRVVYDSLYLVFPAALSAVFATSVFLLPINCSERITTGMAVLVLLSFFFFVVIEKLPATANISLIGIYYTATLTELTCSFFLNLIVLRFYHMTEDNVPTWVKKYILHYGAKILRMMFNSVEDETKSSKKEQNVGHQKEKEEISDFCGKQQGSGRVLATELFVADRVLYSKLMTNREIAARENEWKKAAEVLNNLALALHVILVIATFVFTFLKSFVAYMKQQ